MGIADKIIGFIGAGAMAEALATGLLKAGLVPETQLVVSDVNSQRLAQLKAQLGVKTTSSNQELASSADILVIAVKPHIVSEVLAEIKSQLKEQQVVISIAAGVTTEVLEKQVGKAIPIIRVMPNTPSLVGEGASAICLGKYATSAEEEIAATFFSSVGKVVSIREELIDSVTGLSGSGPAFIYVLIEAMSDAGVLTGLPREVATTLAAQTVLGAAKMVLETGEHPGRLKDMVTTPGGTTITGLHALETGGLRSTIQNAVMAATQRAKGMSEQKPK